jgi:twitching motility protein PilI
MNNSKVIFAEKTIQNNAGDGYLKFQLNQQTAAILAMEHTQEAVILPIEYVTPMPNMPSCILGLMNWRSRIIWAVDLPRMLNLEAIDTRRQQYNAIIIKVDTLILGLVVQEIKGTTKIMLDEIHSPIGQVASSLVPYLRGCVVQQEEILLVLDAKAIVQSSILRSN